ncbi:MAG: 3-keto-disaccharide hydrolase, partial [Planctomycetaceae bacterium]
MMRHLCPPCCLVLLTLLLLSAAVADDAHNTLSEAEKRSGWKLLFDGKSLDGWRNYRKEGIGDGWQVVDGEIRRVGNGAGDIVTTDQYDRFELAIEYKIEPGGNSGLMYHVTETSAPPWHTGPEVQILDNAKGEDPQKAGWLYELYSSPEDATRPAGEWNQIHLRVTPEQCEVNMNGVRYYRFVMGSDDWNRRVAKSKFADLPDFGKTGKGHICLQDHGNLVAFRNIKIRTLGENGTLKDPVDGTLPVKVVQAFPNLNWA